MTEKSIYSETGGPGKKWIKRLVNVLDLITKWEGRLFAWVILIAALQICYEMTMRYFFNAPSAWGLEMTTYLCGTSYVMAGAYAENKNAHIRVDIFYNKWSRRTRAIADLFLKDALLLFICGVLAWQNSNWFWKAYSMQLTSGTIWDPPIWPMRLFLVMGTVFLLMAGISSALRDAYALFTADEL